MTERYNAIIITQDIGWRRAEIADKDLLAISKKKRGGHWEGEVRLINTQGLKVGEKINVVDILVEQNSGSFGNS